jgi:putative ABC transport system permease protein
VGVRKVVGAFRKQLIIQFLYESLALSAAALALASILVGALLPSFNNFVNREISFSFFENALLLPTLIVMIAAVGIFSGIYPAVYITSFQPVKVISGRYINLSGKTRLRNMFVTLQFCISIFFITGMLIIGGQLNYIKNTDIGYDREHVLAMPLTDRAVSNNLNAIKSELLKNPDITYVSSSSHVPNRITWGGRFQSQSGEMVSIRNGTVDYDYVNLFDIDIVEGRNFSREFASDQNGAFLLNETAVKSLGFESVLGREFEHRGQKGKAVGIFRDFHFHSLHNKIEPLYLFFAPGAVRVMFVKIDPGNIQQTVKFIGDTIESFNPSYPFEYFFLDDSFNDMYKTEQKFGIIVRYFSIITFVIACLGLFGLISLSAEMRTKEIGIRKTLGASVSSILNLVTKDYLLLICIAAVIAWPAAYFSADYWLRNFVYRININWYHFFMSGMIVLSIAILTVCVSSFRAARANPVDSLRSE